MLSILYTKEGKKYHPGCSIHLQGEMVNCEERGGGGRRERWREGEREETKKLDSPQLTSDQCAKKKRYIELWTAELVHSKCQCFQSTSHGMLGNIHYQASDWHVLL